MASTEKVMTDDALEQLLSGETTLAQWSGVTAKHAYAIAEVGYRLAEQGKYEDARIIFAGLIALNPSDGYFHAVMGSILARMGLVQEAIEEYTLTMALPKADPNVYVNRAELFLREGKPVEALQDLRKLHKQDPKGKHPASMRARVLAAATSELIKEAVG